MINPWRNFRRRLSLKFSQKACRKKVLSHAIFYFSVTSSIFLASKGPRVGRSLSQTSFRRTLIKIPSRHPEKQLFLPEGAPATLPSLEDVLQKPAVVREKTKGVSPLLSRRGRARFSLRGPRSG